MEEEPDDEDQMWKILSQAMEEAAKQFVEYENAGGRKTEGGFAGQTGLYG